MFRRGGRRRQDAGRRFCCLRLPASCFLFAAVALLAGCVQKPPGDTLVMIIESSPANLDPRVGTDAQSERIDALLFDGLVNRDEHFNLVPGLAERW